MRYRSRYHNRVPYLLRLPLPLPLHLPYPHPCRGVLERAVVMQSGVIHLTHHAVRPQMCIIAEVPGHQTPYLQMFSFNERMQLRMVPRRATGPGPLMHCIG